MLLIIVGCSLLSFGPQKIFGFTLSYIFLVTGRFMLAIGSHGVSINGYILGNIFLILSAKFYKNLLIILFNKQWKPLEVPKKKNVL